MLSISWKFTSTHCTNPYVSTKKNLIKELHIDFIALCRAMILYVLGVVNLF